MSITGAILSVTGAAIASSGANKAAKTQASAAERAAQIQAEAQQKALDEQRRQFDINQGNIAPWMATGKQALAKLGYLTGLDGTTGQGQYVMENDPGYKFRLEQGQQALERSAAARGGLFSGGTGKALERYGQNYASNEFTNVYNRLAGLSGTGQAAAGTAGAEGTAYANSIAQILMSGANAQGNYAQNAAAARATGYQSGGNIWGNAFSGVGNSIMQAYLYKNLFSKPPAPYVPFGVNDYYT